MLRILRSSFAIFLIVSALLLSGCDNQTINYRLTVSIETDGVVQTGSGVIETTWYDQTLFPGLAQGIAWHPEVHGQAIPVDLGKNGVLFFLLKGDPMRKGSNFDEAMLLETLLLGKMTPATTQKQGLMLAVNHKGTVNVPCGSLPMTVRFADIANPQTVERVDPCNLAESFGPGVKFSSATIAVTTERSTTGIRSWLPWLVSLKGGYLTGEQISGPGGLAATLSVADFDF